MAAGAFDPVEFAAFKARPSTPPLAPSVMTDGGGFDPAEFSAFKAAAPAPTPASGDPGALQIRVGSRQKPEAGPSFDDRFAATPMASETDISSGLGQGLRAKADERLIGPSSTKNEGLAALYSAGSEASLNLAGNAAAGAATVLGAYNGSDWRKDLGLPDVPGYQPRPFSENYKRFQDQRDAYARQSPKASLAGTITGIVGGAGLLPGLGGARAATMTGRAGQAALTGGVYGGAAEFADSKDLGRSAAMGTVGAVTGGLLSPAIEKITPKVLALAERAKPAFDRLTGRGVAITTPQGGFTPEAEDALRALGLDPMTLPPDVAAQMQSVFKAKGVSPAVAREAAAGEFGVPLSRGQATQDPRLASMEVDAVTGSRGTGAQKIGEDFTARQGEAIDTARSGLFGLAARDAPRIENPAVAAETVADRARRAASDHSSQVAAAQRAQDDALQALRGEGGGDALDAASAVSQDVRGAADRSRAAYQGAYDEVGGIEGTFVPGAFARAGEKIRGMIGPATPISPRITPAAAEALSMVEDMPRALGLKPGDEPTMQQIMLLRKGMSGLYGSTGQNGTDRHALGEVVKAFDQHVEDLLSIGQFRRADGAAARVADDFPGRPGGVDAPPPGAIVLPDAPRGEPESLVRFLARNGGIPLDGEARAGDLNKLYVPGRGTLARSNAPSWDDLRVRLTEEGFFPYGALDEVSPRDLADTVREMIRAERQGRPTFRMDDEARAGGRRVGERVADENADHAAQVDRQARRITIDMEGYGLRAQDLDRDALNEAAEAMVLGKADDAVIAYDQAVMRRAEGDGAASTARSAGDDVPFPELGEGVGPATSSSLPIGDTGPADAMRNARGLFRDHKQAFSPRGAGDDAGAAIRKIIERNAQPAEIASMLFGSMTRPGEAGLSVRLVERLRDVMGADSPAIAAVQQGLIARVLDGNGTGDVARRLDNLLTGNGRDAASKLLTAEQRRGLAAFRAAIDQSERASQSLPAWIADLSRSDFDANAVAGNLFGSGVPGARVGSSNFAKGLKGFLGEDSSEWSGLRQAALQNLTQPGGQALSPAKEAERVIEFTTGKGAGLAREMFSASELATLDRYASTLKLAEPRRGLTAPSGGREGVARAIATERAAHVLNGLAAAIGFKVAGPAGAGAALALKPGRRLLVDAPGRMNARRSFLDGAPRVPSETSSLPTSQAAVAAALAEQDTRSARR